MPDEPADPEFDASSGGIDLAKVEDRVLFADEAGGAKAFILRFFFVLESSVWSMSGRSRSESSVRRLRENLPLSESLSLGTVDLGSMSSKGARAGSCKSVSPIKRCLGVGGPGSMTSGVEVFVLDGGPATEAFSFTSGMSTSVSFLVEVGERAGGLDLSGTRPSDVERSEGVIALTVVVVGMSATSSDPVDVVSPLVAFVITLNALAWPS